MHVTSGTTGRPKAVWSRPARRPSRREALLAEERDLWGFRADDVNLVLSPLHHSAPLRFAIGTILRAAAESSVPGPFDPATVTAAIETERPTTMFCVPTHLQRLFAHWDEVGVPDLSSLPAGRPRRRPLPVGRQAPADRAVPARLDVGVLRLHRGPVHRLPQRGVAASTPARSGRARPGRHLRVDDDGTIWCTVPEHARFSYWRRPREDRRGLARDPRRTGVHRGRPGRLDDDGYLYLDGRREDLVITGGVNVYPLEVENALREHPGVEDVAVYARTRRRLGPAGLRRRGRACDRGRARGVRPRAPLPRPSAPRRGGSSTTCRARSPARSGASAAGVRRSRTPGAR